MRSVCGPDELKHISSPSFSPSNDGRRFLNSGWGHNVHMVLHGQQDHQLPLHRSAEVSSACSVRENLQSLIHWFGSC